jgi:DNA polymerase-3 subunit alpha
VIESLGVIPTRDVAALRTGARVHLAGLVTALKEIPTRSGGRMAFLTLEDMDGTVELTVFPAAFRAAAALLRGPEPVLVRGRVDDTDKGRVILAEDIDPLDLARSGPAAATRPSPPQACRVRLRGDATSPAVVREVRDILGEHAGPIPVFLHVLLPECEVVVRASAPSVDGSARLTADLERLLGPSAILVEHGRPA